MPKEVYFSKKGNKKVSKIIQKNLQKYLSKDRVDPVSRPLDYPLLKLNLLAENVFYKLNFLQNIWTANSVPWKSNFNIFNSPQYLLTKIYRSGLRVRLGRAPNASENFLPRPAFLPVTIGPIRDARNALTPPNFYNIIILNKIFWLIVGLFWTGLKRAIFVRLTQRTVSS